MNDQNTMADAVEIIENMPTRKRLAYTAVGWAAIGCVVFTVSYGIGKAVKALADNPTELIDL